MSTASGSNSGSSLRDARVLPRRLLPTRGLPGQVGSAISTGKRLSDRHVGLWHGRLHRRTDAAGDTVRRRRQPRCRWHRVAGQHVVAAGVDGIVPCGTTGEFETLSPQEYRTVVRTAATTAPDDCRVIVGTAATDVATVHKRMAFAAEQGADSTLVVPSYYGGQASGAGNEAFFDAVLADAPRPSTSTTSPGPSDRNLHRDGRRARSGRRRRGTRGLLGRPPGRHRGHESDACGFHRLPGPRRPVRPAIVLAGDGGISALSHQPFDDWSRRVRRRKRHCCTGRTSSGTSSRRSRTRVPNSVLRQR